MTDDKIRQVQDEIDQTKETVQKGIEIAIDRGDRLEDLDDKAQNLSNEANLFNRQAKKTRQHFCRQQWKMILLIVVVIAIIVMIIALAICGSGDC